MNKGLELKIIELQHKLTDQTVLNSNLNNQIDQLTSRCQELVAKAGFRDEYLDLQKYVSELEVECEGRRAGEQGLEEELNRVKSELEKAKELHKQVCTIKKMANHTYIYTVFKRNSRVVGGV